MAARRPRLSVSFHNFWRRFDGGSSFFARALGEKFEVSVDRIGSDLQIGSVFGGEPLPSPASGRPLRVWWTGEARDPSGQLFDLYFGFRPATAILGARWHRFPLWATGIDWWDEASPHHIGRLLAPRRLAERPRFCNFIFSSEPSIRTEFFLRLDAVRHVDSLGRVLNNGTRPQGATGKLKVLSESTFTIAFENQIAPGYVTEKLVEPLLAGSIPIYWGAAEARGDFNPDAFIHAEDFDGFDALVRHVIHLADSAEARAPLALAPPFRDNRPNPEYTPAFFVERIEEALSGPRIAALPGPAGHWRQPTLGEKVTGILRRWRA
jgi:hypothetical protein